MELMLDTANIDEITEGIGWLPVSGITTNPTILKRERRATNTSPAHSRNLPQVIDKN